MRLYLAGPVSGVAEFNHPAFRDATERLRHLGHTVWSPAEADLEHGGTAAAMADLPGTFRRDLDALLQQQAIVLLPGWNESKGACLERHAADVCGLRVYLYVARLEEPLMELSRHDWRWRFQR